MSVLKVTHENDEIAVIDALKQQAKAKKAGISLRDMQSLITKVRTELSKQSAPVISAPATTALPKEFQTVRSIRAVMKFQSLEFIHISANI